MEAFLTVSHLNYNYHTLSGETPAIKDLNFSIKEGEFAAIVGPSGCGKSTLLSILSGLLKDDSKAVTFRDRDVRIGYMLQKDHLLEWRNTFDNMTLGLEVQKKKIDSQIREEINGLLKDYGLYEFRNSRPSQLSGGMRQRAALIRTLVLHPDILLLDEPFSALDYQTRLSVADDIYAMIRREHKTTLLITHDISEAISMADRVFVLTKAPASVKAEFNIRLTLDQPRTPLLSRNAPEFAGFFNSIWKELMEHETESENL